MLYRQTKSMLWLSILLLFGLSLNSCDKGDEVLEEPNQEIVKKKEPKEAPKDKPKPQKSKEESKPKEKQVEGEVIIARGFFRYEVKNMQQPSHPDYLEIEITKPLTSLNTKVAIRLLRNGNESLLEGFDAFMEKYKDEVCGCGYGYIDLTWLTYEPKTKKYRLLLPEKGSPEYVDMVPIRDVLAIDYDVKGDVFLITLKTPLQGKVGKAKTYTLKRVEKSIIPPGGYDA